MQIILEAQRLLKALPPLVDVDVPADKHFTVCGDTHGQFYDLCHIFELNGLPSEDNPYLFNGKEELVQLVLSCGGSCVPVAWVRWSQGSGS